MKKRASLSFAVLVLASCLVLGACASGKVSVVPVAPKGTMTKYQTVAITVVNDAGPKCPESVAPNLQAAAIQQLLAKHPNVFSEVRPTPAGGESELLVEVHITKYKKGSRFARAMLIGLGSPKLYTTVNFLDSVSKQKLASGQLSLTWAMGGIMGASKGIEELVDDAGRKVANAIVEQKLGKPAAK